MALVPSQSLLVSIWKQEFAEEMAHRALYLANESHIDLDILEMLRAKCVDVLVVLLGSRHQVPAIAIAPVNRCGAADGE